MPKKKKPTKRPGKKRVITPADPRRTAHIEEITSTLKPSITLYTLALHCGTFGSLKDAMDVAKKIPHVDTVAVTRRKK